MRVTTYFRLKTNAVRADGCCPVYLRVTLAGKRAELSTRIYVEPKSWDTVRQRLKGKSNEVKAVNDRLGKISSNILDIFNRMEATKKKFDVYDLKNQIQGISKEHTLLEMFDYYIATIKSNLGNGYALRTFMQYNTTRNRLAEFLKAIYNRTDAGLYFVDYSFLNAFDIYLKEHHKNNQNTAWGYHKHLKKILNMAIAMDYLEKSPYLKFKVKKQQPKREYLSMHEMDKIKNKEIEIERLRAIRDIFIFACYTGLSYSDIAKLRHDHIQRGFDGNDWIIIDRTKTHTRCRIPLLPTAKEILELYKDYPTCQAKQRLFPVSSNQKMNSYLKELADICEIQKHLTMHVARHTFATSVTLSNGVPIETVSKMLGHTSIKTTQIYARVLESKISEDMKKLSEKIEN